MYFEHSRKPSANNVMKRILLSLILVSALSCGSAWAELVVYDAFDGSEIDPTLWHTDVTGILTQSDGFLSANAPPYNSEGGITTGHILQGDFEVILDWKFDFTYPLDPSGFDSGYYAHLQIGDDDDLNQFGIARFNFPSIDEYLGTKYYFFFEGIGTFVILNGQWLTTSSDGPISATSGFFKITRVGSTINLYYDIGTGWILKGSYPDTFTGPAYFKILVQTGNAGSFNASFDRVTVANHFIVPNVLGMTESFAEHKLHDAGLLKGVVNSAYDDVIPAGQVVSQSPISGTVVEFKSAVDLVISQGPGGGGGGGGGLINMIGAEQQVGAEIGYRIGTQDILLQSQFDPEEEPLGLEDADLHVSLSDIGVSLSSSLVSVFSADQVTANGSSFGSAEWSSPPTDADDVHGGGGSSFALYFTRGSSPAYFSIDGHIDIDIENYPDLNPEEAYVFVRLSSDDGGGTTIWEEVTNGGSGDISLPFAHGLWLETGKTYLLEAYAESGTMADSADSGLKSRMASFSFTGTFTQGEPAHIDVSQDTISTRAKSITCYIWPPEGYDVTQIDASSIMLSDGIIDIPPDRVSVRRNQMLVVKFSTSELSLEPRELELTVSGDLTDGTTFEDSDSVTVVQKGGKPN